MSKNQLIFVFKTLDHIHAPKCLHMPILQIMKPLCYGMCQVQLIGPIQKFWVTQIP
jgi:hypothetical protein